MNPEVKKVDGEINKRFESDRVSLDKKRRTLFNLIEVRLRTRIENVEDAWKINQVESKADNELDSLAKVIKKIKSFIPNRSSDLDKIYNDFVALKIEDREEFIKKSATALSDFLADNFTTDELESMTYYAAQELSEEERYPLNRLLSYGVKGDAVHIHAPLAFIDNTDELRSLFSEGLSLLAEKLKNDPKMADVERVKAISRLVASAPKAFRKAGFRIDSINYKSKIGVAEISKEKLLEIYGKQ